MKLLFATGFLHFVLSLIGEWQIYRPFEIRFGCSLIMFSLFHRAASMRPPSAQRFQCHGIWNHQYDQPHVAFVNVCTEGSKTTHIAATIELAILALSLVGIRRASRHRESSLARLLMAQGVAYFAMVFFLHLSMVVSGSGSVETHIH